MVRGKRRPYEDDVAHKNGEDSITSHPTIIPAPHRGRETTDKNPADTPQPTLKTKEMQKHYQAGKLREGVRGCPLRKGARIKATELPLKPQSGGAVGTAHAERNGDFYLGDATRENQFGS